MKYFVIRNFAVILLLLAMQALAASQAQTRAADFSFDTLWYYRDGTRVVPELGKRWLTVVFEQRYLSGSGDIGASDDAGAIFVRKKARALMQSSRIVTEYLYDPNLAADACFLKMRKGVKPDEIRQLIRRLNQERTVRYCHPTLIVNGRTYAYFNQFEMTWKTGTPDVERKVLLKATHTAQEENEEKDNRYFVDVRSIPFFRALNLLAEDVRVLRVEPHLVEINPSITAKFSLFMSGGNIGDSIPFSLTIAFTDRVNIDPSSISTVNLKPQELQKELFDCTFDPYDYARAATRSPIVITGKVRFYAPGEFTIPPVKISYSCPSCPDKSVRTIETEPTLFRVSSIIPEEKTENRLIVPTDPVRPDYRFDGLLRSARLYFWLSLLSFAGLFTCVVRAWFLLRHRVVAERDRLEERKRGDRLEEQLRGLLDAEPSVPHWIYLGEIGIHLRDFLGIKCGIDSKYRGGSGKQFMETVGSLLSAECATLLGGIFREIDDSVALETESFGEMDRLRSDILKVMDLTAHNAVVHG